MKLKALLTIFLILALPGKLLSVSDFQGVEENKNCYLYQVNNQIDRSGLQPISIEYEPESRMYIVNGSYVDRYNIYANVLNKIPYEKYEMPWWEIAIWSAMAGYITHEIIDND